MPTLVIKMQGDNAWPDLANQKIIHLGNDAKPIELAVLDGGMASGLPSIAMRFDLPDGQVVVAEISARLYCTAARAIVAKYPDLFVDVPRGHPVN